MSFARLLRFGGLPAVVAGALMVVFPFIHPNHDPAGFVSWIWIPAHLSLNIGLILSIFAFTATYALLAERSGWFGLIAYLTACTGSGLMLMVGWVEMYIIPFLGLQDAANVDGPPPPGVETAGMVNQIVFGLGWVLFAVLIWRTQVLPRPIGILLLVGTLIAAFGDMLTGLVPAAEALNFWVVASVLQGSALFLLGEALSPTRPERRAIRSQASNLRTDSREPGQALQRV